MKRQGNRHRERASHIGTTRRSKVRRRACPQCKGCGTVPTAGEIQRALILARRRVTCRQAQVIEARLSRKNVTQISHEFRVGLGTVKSTVAAIYRNLEVSTLEELSDVVYQAVEALQGGQPSATDDSRRG